MMIATVVVLCIVVGVLLFSLQKANKKSASIIEKYKDIIDIEQAVVLSNEKLEKVKDAIVGLENEFRNKEDKLNTEYKLKLEIFEVLTNEISILEENLENISFGLYEPHYSFTTSEEYKNKLEKIRNRQKQIIKDGEATYCPTEWTVGGSKREGAKMTKQGSKLMLRAFNGECDSAISKVSWNNIKNMEARIEKAFQAINVLGSSNHISITQEYLNLKLEELWLEFELEEKIYQEKEEQRRIKEQMREEERALREIEKAQKQAEDNEVKFQKALLKAREEVQKASGMELEVLNLKIKELEGSLKLALEQKERAISRAQMTKSGHVYIISNIGSFGENIYKIGMTRRLEPIDRIKELGDASVPFDFDVHALIYSENAPELENILHRKFEQRRVNLVNIKREFFNVELDEIEDAARAMDLEFQITKMAEAKEFRESRSIRESKNSLQKEIVEAVSKFPITLN